MAPRGGPGARTQTKDAPKPIVRPSVDTDKDKKKKNFYIHILVARIYLPNPENYSTVIHINKNKSDNRLVNLKWVKYYNQSTS